MWDTKKRQIDDVFISRGWETTVHSMFTKCVYDLYNSTVESPLQLHPGVAEADPIPGPFFLRIIARP